MRFPVKLSTTMTRQLLMFSPADRGGLADYAREQANAIAGAGVAVLLLTTPDFDPANKKSCHILPQLSPNTNGSRPGSRIASRMRTARRILNNTRALTRCISRSSCNHVLMGAYSEYLAPLWSGPLRKLARGGVRFGAVVHDPIRDIVIGPKWWHKMSVAAAYSFLSEAFVHEPVELDSGSSPSRFRTTVIPHGIYEFDPPRKRPNLVRQELSVPLSGTLLLAFGLIRDRKNLDLAIRAIRQLPDCYLVVAGQEEGNGQKPLRDYQELAELEGVSERCRWRSGYIPGSEVGDLFGVADLALVTYERKFRSASGVLNIAAGYRKPCVASSGSGNLQTVIKQYGLGVWVEPDSVEALVGGIRQWQKNPSRPDWERYEQEHSWAKNAQLVIERMFDAV
ncbi:MAG: glycosyl transferase family 1 [Verrucomicrobia bacterium]|nr:MAG: glycosyl transferase family 1 [Verrucomicrobiota bacterium]